MNLGIWRGTALALATAQLRSGQELCFLGPGFPSRTTKEERVSLTRDFADAATHHIVDETDNAELLRRAGGIKWSGSG